MNKQWAKHQNASPDYQITFQSDNDRIQYHLKRTIDYLRKHPGKISASKALQKRTALLTALDKYADNKVFPKNIYHVTRRPYFIDKEGRHCAVGYLMQVSGNESLAQKIHDQYNYDYLADIKTPGVSDWAVENGFSLDELAWIQPGYSPTNSLSAIPNGPNGAVNVIVHDSYRGNLILAGDFDLLNESPCLNIGYYEDDQLHCFGTGLVGVVNDVLGYYSEGVVAVGRFEHEGVSSPIALFKDGAWSYIDIPDRAGAIASAAFTGGLGYKMEVAIEQASTPGVQEIWYWNNDGNWQRQASVNGKILDIEASGYGRVYVGYFDLVTINQEGGDNLDLSAKNVIINDNYSDDWYAIGAEVSDTVKVVKSIGNALYFGGSAHSVPNESQSNICLSRYLNSTLQPLILSSSFNEYGSTDDKVYSINSIQLQDNDLIIGGDFSISAAIGDFGKDLASYNLTFNYISSIALLDQPVNTLQNWNGDTYIGGLFTSNLNSIEMPYFARITPLSATKEHEKVSKIQLFPNPTTDLLNIRGITGQFNYKLYSISGKLMKTGTCKDNTIFTKKLPKGAYVLNIIKDTKTYAFQILKE